MGHRDAPPNHSSDSASETSSAVDYAIADGGEVGDWPEHDDEALAADESAAQEIESAPDDGTEADEAFAETVTADSKPGMTDEELLDVLADLRTDITIVGCGGAGCNTVNRLHEADVEGAHMVSMNTDVRDLVDNRADEKVLLGAEGRQDRGRGAGSIPQNGADAAEESIHDIRDVVQTSDMVFVTAGMGGGTGTGSAPVVAEAAREAGALTVGIVTMPFTSEGRMRMQNAQGGVERLRRVCDTLIVIQNDRLLDLVGNLPVEQAFKVADEVLMRSVKGITELITTESLVNLDFADVRTVMEDGGMALIGMGDSSGEYRATNAIKSTVQSTLLDVDVSGADGVLVHVTGSPDMSIAEAEGVVEYVYEHVAPEARIIWGASVDSDVEDEMRVMLVATGVSAPGFDGD